MKHKKTKEEKISILISSIYLLISFVLIGLIIYKYINTKKLDSANIETTIFLLISVVYFFFYYIKRNDKTNLLTDIKGNKLPIGDSKKDKKMRNNNYIKESLIFSVIVVCLDLISILILKKTDGLFIFSNVSFTLNIILNSLITFILCFFVAYLLELLIGKIILKEGRKQK